MPAMLGLSKRKSVFEYERGLIGVLGLSKRKSMFEYERGLIGDLQRMSAYVPRGNILCRFFKRPDSWAPQNKPWSTKKLRKQLGFNSWSPDIGPVRQSTRSSISMDLDSIVSPVPRLSTTTRPLLERRREAEENRTAP